MRRWPMHHHQLHHRRHGRRRQLVRLLLLFLSLLFILLFLVRRPLQRSRQPHHSVKGRHRSLFPHSDHRRHQTLLFLAFPLSLIPPLRRMQQGLPSRIRRRQLLQMIREHELLRMCSQWLQRVGRSLQSLSHQSRRLHGLRRQPLRRQLRSRVRQLLGRLLRQQVDCLHPRPRGNGGRERRVDRRSTRSGSLPRRRGSYRAGGQRASPNPLLISLIQSSCSPTGEFEVMPLTVLPRLCFVAVEDCLFSLIDLLHVGAHVWRVAPGWCRCVLIVSLSSSLAVRMLCD